MTKTKLIVVALVVAAGSIAFFTGRSAGDTPTDSDQPAPTSQFVYFEGATGSFADFRGKPLVVNFWASWCPACVAEMPDFEQTHLLFGDAVQFLGVDVQDVSRERALQFVSQTGITYTLADDPDGVLFTAFEGFTMPTTIFIDAEGNIVGRQNGAMFGDQLADTINDLFFES